MMHQFPHPYCDQFLVRDDYNVNCYKRKRPCHNLYYTKFHIMLTKFFCVELSMLDHSKPLILVDGSSYLYRAFHALPALTNSKGFPTGAVYGLVNMLKRLIQDYHPDYMAVVFDAKGKTFRDEIYKAYKATRPIMPNDLTVQIAPIYQIIKALGIPLLVIDGVEADDVIGTLAKRAKDDGIKSVVSTSDKDLAQLVDEYITLVNTMTNVVLNPQMVEQKFGVSPACIVDYLTLVGDSSDNIPGVPLVGPKTAAKWLQQYGSLQAIIAHANKIPGKAGENLRKSIPQLPLINSLVTIKCDVDLLVNFNELAIQPPNKPELIMLYKEMEFKTWLSELLVENKADEAIKYANYVIVDHEESLNACIEKLQRVSIFAFATETTDPRGGQGPFVGLSIAMKPGQAYYLPFGHHFSSQHLDQATIINRLKPFFENPAIKKIAQNLKYDLTVLEKVGIKLQGQLFDTMVEAYILDSTATQYDLATLALKYLGWRTTLLEEVIGKGPKKLTFDQISIAEAGIFAAEEADVTLHLHQLLIPRIVKEAGLNRVFEEIEMPLVPVLKSIENHGVLIDAKKLNDQGQELCSRLQALEMEAYQIAGKVFNMNSPKQLQEILFQNLKLPILQKTPKGQASTADQVLQELALEFPLPKIIIEYRALSKLMSTYTNRLPQQIDSGTGRVHTSYHQTGTATGRLSSSDPNLQNIPIRTQEGRRIRQAFIAPPGYKILSADYSQIELRLMAHISQDLNLINAFNQNLDIHQATAAELMGISLEDVTPDMRRNAKAINFGLIYGMSAYGLTRQLGIEREAAQAYIDRYFERYPLVKAYMDHARQTAKTRGFVETLWGRRLYIPDINASQISRQRASERAAINAPLQGSAADIIKLAMIRIDQWLRETEIPAKMIMQVHDELVFEVRSDLVQSVAEKICNIMINITKLQVPLLVSIGNGNNWDEAAAH